MGAHILSQFNEIKLREFLVALMANGTRPSPSLIRALSKISSFEETEVEIMVLEIFGPAPEKKSPPQRQKLSA